MTNFYNEYIPFSRVKGVINVCGHTGVTAYSWVNVFVRDLSRLDEYKPSRHKQIPGSFRCELSSSIPDRYWIHMSTSLNRKDF